MLTLDRKQQPLVLREWRGFEPPFLGGILFAALALVPITANGPFTPQRWLGLGMLLALASALMFVGRPRSRRRSLPGRASAALGMRAEPVALKLEGSPLPPTYRAVLVLEDGSRRTVLERDEPAGVLEDAALLAREFDIAIVPGWGIEQATLDALIHPPEHGAPRPSSAAPFRFDSPPLAGQRNAAWTTLWASAFVLVATIAMSDAARSRVTPGSLSLTLPGVSVVLVLLVWLWLVGLRGELEVGPASVTRREFWFRSMLGRPERLEIKAVSGAFVVPGEADAGHLVISDGARLFAFPLRGGSPQLARLCEQLSARPTHRAAE